MSLIIWIIFQTALLKNGSVWWWWTGPKAVWPAIHELESLIWRDGSDRLTYLIGDAPPHGFDAPGDAWPKGDPSGITSNDLISILQKLKVKLNAHSIANDSHATRAFTLLTEATHGEISVGDRPENSTTLYSTSVSSTATSISTGRTLYTNTVGSTGTYTTADAMEVGADLGWDQEVTNNAINYLTTRGITDEEDKKKDDKNKK
jgi:hypothetical protein